MFESLTAFVNDVTSFSLNLPFSLKIAIIITVMIALIAGMYLVREHFEISYFRSAYFWYFFVAMVNLINLLVIYYFYYSKSGNYKGQKGRPGKKGKHGKGGKSVTCSYCKSNIYIQKSRRADIICTLSAYTPTTFTDSFTTIKNNMSYFNQLIENGSIEYDQFVNKIILEKTGDPSKSDAVTKFDTLMQPKALTYQLIYNLNEVTANASKDTYCTFRRPIGVTGYIPIGDCVYGGVENFELNSFLLNGDIMYPQSYTLLVSFKSYNQDTEDYDTYTIWRPVGQTINQIKQVTQTSNTTVSVNYIPMGDVCMFGTSNPQLNSLATIRESCLEKIPHSYMSLVFLYMGDLEFTDFAKVDYTKELDYLIENKLSNTVQLFSVWRTPMNTFITNSNQDNKIVNNSLAYNIYNNLDEALNDYGNIKTAAKQYLTQYFEAIQISKTTVAALLCRYFETEYTRELQYYINQSQTQRAGAYDVGVSNYDENMPTTTKSDTPIPTATSIFSSIKTTGSKLGDMMKAVQDTMDAYDKYNTNLSKESVNSKGPYNLKAEKHLPPELLKVYNRINTDLLTLPVQIQNTSSLLDIINVIFDSGIETRIAVDAEGIHEGGTLLNEVQEIVLRICKVLMPPATPVYMIKDECLGSFPMDKNRNEIIRQLTEQITFHRKFLDIRNENPDKYQTIWSTVRQNEDLLNLELGKIVGHIKNWQKKLMNMDLEQFSTSRLESMYFIYEKTNKFYNTAFANV